MARLKELFKRPLKKIKGLFPRRQQELDKLNRELDGLYKVLYDQVHDLEESRELVRHATARAFSKQWSERPTGHYLLSDPWFRENVADILATRELQIRPDWFAGKKVLDAGCGNGRWAYGFSKLGVDLTCADVNTSALEATQQATVEFSNPRRFIHTPLEELHHHIEPGTFDLAFSWGVIHHCRSFNQSLQNVASAVKPGGILYIYLYGRDSLSMQKDLDQFKTRIQYNFVMNEAEQEAFLLKLAKGDKNAVHNVHDVYAPLINRRLRFDEVEPQLAAMGFTQITQTIDHTELFIRAVKGPCQDDSIFLPKQQAPFWFQHHASKAKP